MAGRSASVPSVEITSTFIATVQLVHPAGGGGAVTTSVDAVLAESVPDRAVRESRPAGSAGAMPWFGSGSGTGGAFTWPRPCEWIFGGATGPRRSFSIGAPRQAGP